MPASPLGPLDPDSVGPFLLLGRVAVGGMGVAYLGRRHGRPDSLVVVKTVRPDVEADSALVDRLRSEARVARELAALLPDGCALARFVAAEPDSARPWIATEYVPGPSLLEVARGRGMPTPEVAALAAEVAAAVAALHRLGYAHRDVKPANVVVGPDGARLVDLGLTRHVTAPPDGVPMGSPGWSPPEQNEDAPDARPADVHGWAMCVAYAAAGRPPFGTGSAPIVTRRMRTGRPRLHDVPPALQPLLAAALRPDPLGRPSVQEVLDRLALLGPLDREAALPGGQQVGESPTGLLPGGAAAPFTQALGAPTLVEIPAASAPAGTTPAVMTASRPARRRRGSDAGVRRRALLASAAAAAVVLLWAALPHGPGSADTPAAPTPTTASTPTPRATPTATSAVRPVATSSPLAQRSTPRSAGTHAGNGKGHKRKH